MTERKMAIMKDVTFGCWDYGVGLKFSTYTEENVTACEYMQAEESIDFIKAYCVKDVHGLEGKPVWVDCDGETIRVAGPCVI